MSSGIKIKIQITGPMGSGKSIMGRVLGRFLNWTMPPKSSFVIEVAQAEWQLKKEHKPEEFVEVWGISEGSNKDFEYWAGYHSQMEWRNEE